MPAVGVELLGTGQTVKSVKDGGPMMTTRSPPSCGGHESGGRWGYESAEETKVVCREGREVTRREAWQQENDDITDGDRGEEREGGREKKGKREEQGDRRVGGEQERKEGAEWEREGTFWTSGRGERRDCNEGDRRLRRRG